MEKYGEIPKKFTAKWFEYIWEYYKWHIIVVVAVIIAGVYTWYSIANRTIYDLTVCFAGDNIISERAEKKLTDALAAEIEDINGDGEKNIKILQTSTGQTDDFELMQLTEQKFHLELQASDTYLYLISKERVESLSGNSSADGLFEATESWCGKEGENEFFIDADESEILKKSGMIYNDLYIGLRNFVSGRDGEADRAMRENALIAGKAILR